MIKSLLWKNKQSKPVIEEQKYQEITADFNLAKLYALMSNEPRTKMTSEIFLGALTSDYENINYRQCILADFLKRKDITENLEELIFLLDKMAELHRTLRPELLVPKLILRLRKLELFHLIMTTLENVFSKKDRDDYSEEFLNISKEISEVNKKNNMVVLVEDIKKIKEILGKTKSIDIGINLDHQYTAREAIILSLNEYIYKKSNIVEKLLCSDENEKNKLSIASEIDVRNAGSLLSFKNDLDIEFAELLKNEFSEIEKILSGYSDIITSDVMEYRNEISLYYGALRLHDFLKKQGCNSCLPKESKCLDVYGMYSYVMAYEKNISIDDEKFKVISNDIKVEENESPCIITGANEGGKTVFLISLASLQLLFQNGLMVPASSAKMPVYEKIFSHFPKDEDLSLGTGRLGEEAVRVSDILKKADDKSIVFMNEPFITTSPTEGLDILVLSIKRFCENGVKLYFVTHYLDIIQELGNIVNIASYVMEYENGIRTYKAIKMLPMTESHALDIAKAHGIDKEGIIGLINDRFPETSSEVTS